jgi:hypothetical protein
LHAIGSYPIDRKIFTGFILLDFDDVPEKGIAQVGFLRMGLVAAAVCALVIPVPSSAVERLYSARMYVALQPVVTSVSNRTPIALLDLFIGLVVGLWIGLAVRDARRSSGRRRALALIALRTISWSAALYLVFLATWGLNYRRVRLVDKVPFDAAAVTADAARLAGGIAADQLNALHDPAHAEGWPAVDRIDPALSAAFAGAAREAGISSGIVVGRPKRTMLDLYFRRAGVDGMTDPFFLETLVAGSVLPFERPFVVAHEWSHLAGIADEGEANFVGWLSCVRGSVRDQYSGWLFLYGEFAAAMGGPDRAALTARLGPGPRADLRAIRDRFAREVNRRLSTAGWRIYDSYLKANRVESGAASYAEVVRLVLGVRLPSGPALRVPPDAH